MVVTGRVHAFAWRETLSRPVRRAAQEERNRRTAVQSFRREPIEHLEQCIYLFHLHGEIAWCARPVFAEPRHEAYRPSWMVCRAFARAACDDRISGVDFDVRYVADTGNLVVSHDPLHIENALTLDAALSFLSQTALELFVEIKETGLASVVIDKLVSSNVAHRSDNGRRPWLDDAMGRPAALGDSWHDGRRARNSRGSLTRGSTRGVLLQR